MTKSGDLCRTTCLALGGVITLALIIGLGGAMGVFWGLLFGLVLGGVATVCMLRFVCLADVVTGPVTSARSQSAEAMHAPSGEVQPGQAPEAEATAETAAEADAEAAEEAGKAEAGAEPAVAPEVKPEAAEPAAEEVVAAPEAAPAAEEVKPRKPRTMKQPRKAGPDDLKQIRGIGPKAEEMLNEMGIFHISQIAKWTEAEVAWADENLTGLKGRVSRDEWVAQAQDLAAGGDKE